MALNFATIEHSICQGCGEHIQRIQMDYAPWGHASHRRDHKAVPTGVANTDTTLAI